MTLKQFLQLAGGIILGVLIFASPLPFFFKYPLSILSIFLGVGMAFIPVGGRPMDQWIIAFIKSIYSPTLYIWKKQEIESENTDPNTTPTPTPIPNSQTSARPQPNPSPTPIQQTPPPNNSTPPTQPHTNSQKNIAQLPIPSMPTAPNTLTGLTLNPEGHILEGAIIEIKKNNNSIRATKSNKLGQFIFIRPLENGIYTILTEKENYSFPSYSLNLQGKIIPPLKLQAITN